jgi:soluble lytic murein transglycosylase-like protein
MKIVIPFHKALPEQDTQAYKMSLLGYSAKEISDVISGRITLRALDRAFKMRLLGHSEQEVSNYLDGAYRKSLANHREALIMERSSDGPASKTIVGPPYLDELAVRFSEKHGLSPQIIRAIIKAESNWVPEAVSKKGAVGLMQLMPGTAALLKVDPSDPEQNVEGGARYFSFLFDTFKDLDLALIAYNAGPGYAERYAQGKVSLYGETRQYVRLVKMYFARE